MDLHTYVQNAHNKLQSCPFPHTGPHSCICLLPLHSEGQALALAVHLEHLYPPVVKLDSVRHMFQSGEPREEDIQFDTLTQTCGSDNKNGRTD